MKPGAKALFRSEAIHALTAQEDLSQELKVIPLKARWMVIVLVVLIGLIIGWSCLGHLDRTISGRGVIIDNNAYIYIPVRYTNEVTPGMSIRFDPLMTPKERYGYMVGRVESVSPYPVEEGVALSHIKSRALLKLLMKDDVVLEVKANLRPNPKTKSGYFWSVGKGPHFKLANGTLADADIMIETLHPIEIVFPFLNKYLDAREDD